MAAIIIMEVSSFRIQPGPEVIKLFFMLNSAVHEICPAIKSQITNSCKCFLANITEHENFSANKYENANNCWHFHIF